MKPPAKVRVGPHVYAIAVDDGALAAAGRVGQTQADALRITLASDQHPSAIADTLLHECVHALLRPAELDEATEERAALALGTGLLGLIRDNPKLVAFLLGAK